VLHLLALIKTSDAVRNAAAHELTAWKAAILGMVEGITEYLPVSSTGHLIVANRILDIGQHKATKDAADTYTITIQAGAILAVLVLFWSRIVEMFRGLVGRDEGGRKLLNAMVVAFIPAAIVGVLLEKPIKDRLFGTWPVIVAWIVGGLVILAIAKPLFERAQHGYALEAVTVRAALIIGLAQVLAIWPGTSRSLVTIVAALAVGMTMSAAVEFSFILGLLTLGAATAFEALKHGKEMIDTYGVAHPLIGFVVAFLFALLAVKWLVSYLQRHGIAIFGWYRIGIAIVVIILIATGVI
jgi:undecaprenyl-diphosphatase